MYNVSKSCFAGHYSWFQ